MRLIWTTPNLDYLRAFTDIIKAQNISFSVEERVNRDWASDSYGNKEFLLWIQEEDQVAESLQLLQTFLKNPQVQIPQASHSTITEYVESKIPHKIKESEAKTNLLEVALSMAILLLCSVLFLFDMMGERPLDHAPAAAQNLIFTSSPVKKALLYDYPLSNQLLDKIVLLYGYDALAKPEELPPPGKFLYQQYKNEPKWKGFYPYLVSFGNKEIGPVKLFEKEKEGEYFRLITPIFLHNDILHLFFNMIWLLLLCPQMEIRIGGWKLFFFILLTAMITNTAQYLMSGPYFLGFSGIICAQVFFIRHRQMKAPWEGYLMSKSTFAFICFFIGILAAFSLICFILQAFFNIHINIAIANTAHLLGAALGYLFGGMKFFSQRP